MSALVLSLPGSETLARAVASALHVDCAAIDLHRFPDGESLPRVEATVAERNVAVFCTLDRPDSRVLPLLFSARLLRELGAASVGIVAPYLAYMRQDRRFHPGEALTSVDFAELLSGRFDWLVTIDPHLHRYSSLSQLYRIPTVTLQSRALLSGFLRTLRRPLVIGPDQESEQWAATVAEAVGAPHVVLEKTRFGDRDVRVRVPELARRDACTPVLLDDIISSARTMIAALDGWPDAASRPVCVGIHAVFAPAAYEELLAARPARIVTTNTIAHATNGIDVASLLADGVRNLRLIDSQWEF